MAITSQLGDILYIDFYCTLDSKITITIFTSKKTNIVKDILIKMSPLLIQLLPLYYDFYKRKSEKLVIISQSADVFINLSSMYTSHPVTTSILWFL